MSDAVSHYPSNVQVTKGIVGRAVEASQPGKDEMQMRVAADIAGVKDRQSLKIVFVASKAVF